MDDEAILARVDREPDGFAILYRRHARRLLDHLVGRSGDPRLAAELCAETFAAALIGAHRFEPEHGDAAAWLDGISRRLLARAERRGTAPDRARRRLGIAPVEPGEAFVEELEEELVAAARFRASRRRPRRPLPRPPGRVVLGALAGVAAAGLAAGVAAFALGGDDDPPQPRAATSGPSARLVAMMPPPRCLVRTSDERPASPAIPYFRLFQHRPRIDDALGGDLAESLPVASYDRRETKLAANGRRGTRLHLVPSLGVSEDGSCAADDGPGVCLVQEDAGRFRCFGIERIRAGLAFARTGRGSIVGVVPDGVGRVTLSAGGQRASGRVSGNVYEAELGVPSGTRVSVAAEGPGEDGCAREVAPGLLHRVAVLRRAPGEQVLPQAALGRLREDGRIAEVVERGARVWGADGSVEFWVVPVVPSGEADCAPANRVCLVAVPDGADPDAHCALDAANREGWSVAPLYAGNAVVLGIVPDRATGARVTIGGQSAMVDADQNVLAGMLPFPHDDFATTSVEPTYDRDPAKPRVAVVDAAGRQGRYHAEYLLRRLGEGGYPTADAITPGVKAQAGTDLYWRPGRTPDLEIGRIAKLLRVDRVIRIEDPDRTPGPVLRTGAPIVVVAGQGRPGPG